MSNSTLSEKPVPPAPQSPAKIHLGYLDGLRAFAAVFVVLHHMYLHSPIVGGPHLAQRILSVFLYGHYAVDLFIVLSGFCLMLPVSRGDGRMKDGVWAFYKKRARRILPPYYATLAVSMLLITFWIGQRTGTHWDVSVPVSAKDVVLHAFLLEDVVSSTSDTINHVLWSVAVEWRIYFLFPLLVLAFRRFGGALTTGVALVATYLFWYALYVSPATAWVNTTWQGCSPYYLGLFAMGMLASNIVFARAPQMEGLRSKVRWDLATIGAAVLLGAATAIPHVLGSSAPKHYMSFFMGLLGATLLIWVSLNPRCWAARLLSVRPLVFLGTYAYSIYLVHAPLIQMIWKYAVHPLKQNTFHEFLLMAVLGTPVILAACYLFFLAFERPFLTTRRKETKAETERDAALSPAP